MCKLTLTSCSDSEKASLPIETYKKTFRKLHAYLLEELDLETTDTADQLYAKQVIVDKTQLARVKGSKVNRDRVECLLDMAVYWDVNKYENFLRILEPRQQHVHATLKQTLRDIHKQN